MFKTTMQNILKVSLLLIFFASCQKELELDKIDKIDKVSFLIKTATDTRNGVSITTNYRYDTQGRVISTTSTSGENRVYNYSSNSYEVKIFNGTVASGSETYYLNNLPRVDSAVFAGKTDTTARKYIYNGQNWLVQEKDYNIKNGQPILVKTTIAEYDANGNVSREYNTNNNQISYTYTDLLFNLNAGLIYFGNNKNFIKTSTYSGYLNSTFSYNYKFDNDDRLINETVVDQDGKIILTEDYTY